MPVMVSGCKPDLRIMNPKHIIFDTDPGIDDSLAILLALALPELALDGISIVHGNATTAPVTTSALSVLYLAKASRIPVYKGCEPPRQFIEICEQRTTGLIHNNRHGIVRSRIH